METFFSLYVRTKSVATILSLLAVAAGAATHQTAVLSPVSRRSSDFRWDGPISADDRDLLHPWFDSLLDAQRAWKRGDRDGARVCLTRAIVATERLGPLLPNKEKAISRLESLIERTKFPVWAWGYHRLASLAKRHGRGAIIRAASL